MQKKGTMPMKNEVPEDFMNLLEERFTTNKARHAGVEWGEVRKRLEAKPEKLQSLYEMEDSGGEPDVIGSDSKTGEIVFCDCSPESPAGRRSLCYDRVALDSRKEHKPLTSAMEMAARMGVEILTEDQYRELQKFGEFDKKTSSWILTPSSIRDLGGALFCDRRYDQVFVYHNGADSYYAVRGFRGRLKL
ncbi:MAG TPA: DUF4256 domain-containing protein [Rectinemataceae bacterium]|nr:DUF4256 domain-containing protein [Rectinemataceae bacterium]